MKTNIKIIISEGVAALLLLVCTTLKEYLLPTIDIPIIAWQSVAQISQNCFDLNVALVIAFIISLMLDDSFQYKKRRLPLIAKNAIYLVAFNSTILLLSPILNNYSIIVVIPALYGNAQKVWDLAKHILKTV